MNNYQHIETQKITAHLPVALLQNAMQVTGKGITETLRDGLESLAKSNSCEQLLNLRGKVKFSLSLEELRGEKDE